MNKAISYIMVLIVLGTTSVLPLYYLHLFELENNIQTSQNLFEYSQENHVELTVKVPISLPYATEYNAEANGLLEYNGEYFTIISKKYENDTLYFKCIQNLNAREIFNSLTNHIEKSVKDSPSKENNKSQLALIFKFISQKIENIHTDFLLADGNFVNKQKAKFQYNLSYKSIITDFISPPPRFS